MKKREFIVPLLLVLLTSFINATTYEDAEDGTTNGWSAYSTNSNIATITNVYDSEKKSKVISLNRNGGESSFVLGHWSNSTKWNNKKDKLIQWSMKYTNGFIIYVSLETTEGQRYLMYRPRDNYRGTLSNGKYIYHGIGAGVNDGTWQTFTRDLEADLKDLQPNNSIVAVNSFQISGEGLVDDIELNSNKMVYEDAEDGTTNGWSAYSTNSNIATITNVYDSEKKSKVISLNRNGGKSSFVLGHWSNSTKWNNKKDKLIQWSMKYTNGFIIYVSLETTEGQRYLMYRPKDNYRGTLSNGQYIYHGIGAGVNDGTWQTFTRDLEADLKDLQHNNSIVAVNSFQISGEGLVDDIGLMLTEDSNGTQEDTTPPVITLNGDANVTIEKDGNYTELNATALDDVDGNVSVTISGAVDTSTVGVYILTYSATDVAGNESNVTRTVNVVNEAIVDITPPVITLNGDANVTIEKDGIYTELNATAVDDVDENVSVTISGTVDTSTIGVYILTYSATDVAGNEVNVTRTINVVNETIVDTTPPVITLNGDANVTIEKDGIYTELNATAVDDVDGNVSVTISGTVDTSTVRTYTITYTTVDSAGNRATLSRTVNVIEPVVKYGVNIGEVQGNTATYHNIARFSVSLKSKPEANVTIPISSSDINEGKVISLDGDASKLVFTTDNWNIPQTVLIEGQNQNVVDGVQNYTIVLDSIISDDANYDGINPDDIEMKGLVLTLTKPIDTTNFIATLPKIMCLKTTYNGREDLTYSFTQKPDRMTINDDGCIVWTAPLSEEGSTHTVSIEASNGSKTQTISFDVHVSQTEVLQSETNNSLVSIIEPNTTLNGVKFRFLGNNPTIPTIRKVENQGLVTIPNGIQVLSDYFYADENNTDDVEVLIPISKLNDIHDFPRLSLYYMAKHEISAKPIWNMTSMNLKVEVVNGADYGVLSIGSLKGIMFIGIRAKTVGTKAPVQQKQSRKILLKQTANPATITVNDIHCTPNQWVFPILDIILSTDYEVQTCTIDVDGLRDITYTVEGFGNDNGRINHWNPATSIEEMMVWIGEARSEFNRLGIGTFDKDIEIWIQPSSTLDSPLNNGEVHPDIFENSKVLHLKIDNLYKTMKYTVAHEYFHHAQAKTKLDDILHTNIFTGTFIGLLKRKIWLYESTAEWFADYLYDKENYYLTFGSVMSFADILIDGLDTSDGDEYRTMLFMKLLSEKCNSFETEIAHLFYGNFGIGTGIENTIFFLSNPDTGCNFGNSLGEDKNNSIDTAMLYYQYATKQERNIILIDSKEEKNNIDYFFTIAQTIDKNRWKMIKDYYYYVQKILQYGAISFKLNYKDTKDTNKTQITLSIKTDKPLTVVGLRLNKDGKGIASRVENGAFNRIDGDFNFTTEAGVVKEYILTEENAKGGLFITLLNATGEEVSISDINITSRFERDDENNIVIDHKTNLMWQDETDTWLDSWYGAGRYCTALTLGDYDDWRVPTYDELIHILDLDGKNTYRYDIFEHLGPVGYWSSKLNDGDSESAKVVNFGLATWIWINTSAQMNTRCVRTK